MKKTGKIILSVLLCLAAVVSVWRIGVRVKNSVDFNASLEKKENRFAVMAGSPYAQGIPLEEMDTKKLLERYGGSSFLLPMEKPKVSTAFTLPCDIEYYRSLEDEEPFYTLKRGTEVIAFADSSGTVVDGYGFTSLPTYEKGWRYVRMFLSVGNGSVSGDGPVSRSGYYYVRLDDLLDAAIAARWQSGMEYWEARSLIYSGRWPDLEAGARNMVLKLDRKFYSDEVFFSQDLYCTIWDRTDTVFFLVAVISVLGIVLLWIGRRKKPASPQP